MKWNLAVVAIAALLSIGTRNVWSQTEDSELSGFRRSQVSSTNVSDGAASMKVGDDGPANSYFRQSSSPLYPAHFQDPDEGKPAVEADRPNAANTMNPGCGTAGCTSPGCTGGSCCAIGCAPDGCDWCDTYDASCCRWGGAWGSFEYMHVWARGSNLPPLVTGAPNGVLPGSNVIIGGDRAGDTLQSAGRITAGLWTDSQNCNGVGMRVMGLEGNKTRFNAISDGTNVLGRPFFNTTINANDALIIASPLVPRSGSVNVLTSNDVYTAEAFLRLNIDRGVDYRVDVVTGYHFARVDDGLTIINDSINTAPEGFGMVDDFNARNEFHGGSFGFLGEYGTGPWTVSMLAKFSIGRQYEQVRIRGSSYSVDGGGNRTDFNGGLLALGANLGSFERNETVYIPEVSVNFNRQLTDNLSLSIGYSFIYWSSMLLAGDQIDNQVAASQVLGGPLAARPAFVFYDRDYWLHAINFGVNYRF